MTVNSEGSFAYTSVNFLNRCFGSDALIYGQSLVRREVSSAAYFVDGVDSSDTTSALVSVKDLAGVKSFDSSFCVAKPAESSTGPEADEVAPNPSFDNRIEEVVLNGAATASAYRLAYITRQADVFFSNCLKKIVDTEIRLVAVSGEEAMFANLLDPQNRAEIADETPAGASCP